MLKFTQRFSTPLYPAGFKLSELSARNHGQSHDRVCYYYIQKKNSFIVSGLRLVSLYIFEIATQIHNNLYTSLRPFLHKPRHRVAAPRKTQIHLSLTLVLRDTATLLVEASHVTCRSRTAALPRLYVERASFDPFSDMEHLSSTSPLNPTHCPNLKPPSCFGLISDNLRTLCRGSPLSSP